LHEAALRGDSTANAAAATQRQITNKQVFV